jgi:predicted site-specific integrase-resolvase
MKAGEVKKKLGVTQATLNNWVKRGKINYIIINPYHYEYSEEDVLSMLGNPHKSAEKNNVTYSRVSLSKQKNDLNSQTKRLYDFCISKGITISKQYEDVKSGMNFSDRKQFNEILTEVIKGGIDNIIIENRDRLCRFGFDLFEQFCKYVGTNIIVASKSDNNSYEQELTDNLISIIHYFSMKSYSHRRKLNQIKKELIKQKSNL